MNKPKIYLSYLYKYLRAYWRVWLGFCPMCNSDAPEVDNCPTCENNRDKSLLLSWRDDYLKTIAVQKNIRLMVLANKKLRGAK